MNTSRLPGWQLGTIHSVLIALLWAPVLPAFSAPAQRPLFTRTGSPVAPNVMFTFDDSGSMAWSHLPDELWTATYKPIMHPNDTEGDPNSCVARTDMTGDNWINLYKVRSPAFNGAYYNPNIYYRPWSRSDGSLAPAASFTNAAIQPLDLVNNTAPNPVANLSNTTTTYRRPWCNNNGSLENYESCGNNCSQPRAHAINAAIYYRFTGNSALTSSVNTASNYTLVNLNAIADVYNAVALAKHPKRIDCAGAKCSLAEEQQNFANWFTYYRNRNLLAKAGASRAFSAQTGDMRVGYGRINNLTQAAELNSVTGAPTSTVLRGVRSFSPNSADRNQFFTALYSMPASGGTPLRRAMDDVGKYFSIEPDVGPWGNNPGPTASKTLLTAQKACRKSYHILVTDGYWNGDAAGTAAARLDVDSTAGPLIEKNYLNKTYKYDPTRVTMYKDNSGSSGTLADIAMYYWNRDLHLNLDNNITPSPGSDAATDRGDHAFWQHMTTFTVGLGVLGSISDRSVVPPAGGWPIPPSGGNDRRTVDDLWHAAVNGRGESLSAADPDTFATALGGFLSTIISAQDPVTNTGVSSFIVTGSSKRYKPYYDEAKWTGRLEAFSIANGANRNLMLWDASTKIPAFDQRVVATWKPGSPIGTSEDFGTGMDNALKTASLWGLPAAPSDNLIKFIRGDRSNEGSIFRCRGASKGTTDCTETITRGLGRLGDIVNSTPLLVKSSLDMNYHLLPSVGGSYLTHLSNKRSRRDGIVFVGANDGMLHGFLDSTGTEVFSYIPYEVYGNLPRLADRNYGDESTPALQHRYFVDGPLTEADAYLNGNWTNLVVGSLGGGGKAIFAVKVDTTNPTSMSKSNLLWEFNSRNSSALGYVTQPIATGLMKNGQWAAIFGNGLDSADGTANLFIVNLSTGQLIRSIQAGSATGNGLGGVKLIRGFDQVVIGAYAGDNKGNMWRFDLESTSSSAWKVGMGELALFSAGATKPITAAPTYLTHPLGGLLVIFGTGKLYAEGDQTSTTPQTAYGIWDKTALGVASVAGDVVANTNELLQQSFSTTPFTSDGTSYYQLSSNAISWKGSNAKKGWFVDLNLAAGQRNVFAPLLVSKVAIMNTVAPAGTGDDCQGSNTDSYSLIFDPYTGGQVALPFADTNGDSKVDKSDKGFAARKKKFDGAPSIVARPYDPVFNPEGGTIDLDGGDDDDDGTSGSGSELRFPEFARRFWRTIPNFPR